MELLFGSRKRRTDTDAFLRQKRLCLKSNDCALPSPINCYVSSSSTTQIDLRSLTRFHNLIDDDNNIAACLKRDLCKRFSDKYLLAQTYIYFIRCRLKPDEYTPRNFYYLLYLANDMEEDLDFKHEILPWCMGPSWRSKFVDFQREKQQIWKRMNFKLLVRPEELEMVLRAGNHWIWSRDRSEHHAGAVRDCKRPSYEVSIQPQGPSGQSMKCNKCNRQSPQFHWSDYSDDSPVFSGRRKNILSDSDSDSAYFSHNTSLV